MNCGKAFNFSISLRIIYLFLFFFFTFRASKSLRQFTFHVAHRILNRFCYARRGQSTMAVAFRDGKRTGPNDEQRWEQRPPNKTTASSSERNEKKLWSKWNARIRIYNNEHNNIGTHSAHRIIFYNNMYLHIGTTSQAACRLTLANAEKTRERERERRRGRVRQSPRAMKRKAGKSVECN